MGVYPTEVLLASRLCALRGQIDVSHHAMKFVCYKETFSQTELSEFLASEPGRISIRRLKTRLNFRDSTNRAQLNWFTNFVGP